MLLVAQAVRVGFFCCPNHRLNPDRPGESTRDLDRFGFVKRPAGATTRQNPIDPAGRPMTRATWANQDETRCFFSLFKCGFLSFDLPSYFIIFFTMSCCQQQQRGKEREGRCRWRLVEGEVGQAGVSVGGGSGLAKRWRRLGKKKEELFSFGQKTRGMTEKGMREVVVGVFIPCCLTECLL